MPYWKVKRAFYDHDRGRVVKVGEVVTLSEGTRKHAVRHDLVDVVAAPAPARPDASLLEEGTKPELLAELDKFAPGHGLDMKDNKAALRAAFEELL